MTVKRGPQATPAQSALGGLRAAANMTAEERSARARAASRARWDRVNAEREAAGLPPTRKRPTEPSADVLEFWLQEVDRRFPDREWPSSEARRRQAILLLRIATAEAAAEAGL